MHSITSKSCFFYLISYCHNHNCMTVQWYETNGWKKIVQKSKKNHLNNDAHLKDLIRNYPVRVNPVQWRLGQSQYRKVLS